MLCGAALPRFGITAQSADLRTRSRRVQRVSAVDERFSRNSGKQWDLARAKRRERPFRFRAEAVAPAVSLVVMGVAALPAFADVASDPTTIVVTEFVPDEVEEWQLWAGFIAGVSPFVIAAWEFGKRIVIQRQCEVCKGSGLIQRGKYERLYKCNACGGFLPWQSWDRFFESSPGNGGVLQYPKGQKNVLFDVELARSASKDMKDKIVEKVEEEDISKN